MSENTSIEWADHTFNAWEGCTKVSPGCDNCYAEARNTRFHGGANWGPRAPRLIRSEAYWGLPIKWQRDAPKFDTLHRRRQRVFCSSLADVFDNEAPGLQRERLFAVIRLTPALDWLLLTKRIGNAAAMLPKDWGDGYPNVWIGSTVVNQEEADRDIPKLLTAPTRVRFLSCEPLLGPIDLHDHLIRSLNGFAPALHWVIAGGESGHKARPAHPDWFRSLRDQCAAAGVPFLFKQWGEWSGPGLSFPDGRPQLIEPDEAARFKVGKKAAGRELDGRTHDGMPT